MDALFSVARLVLGAYFLFNALNHFFNLRGLSQYAQAKGVPAPALMVAITGLMLAAGGLSLLLGSHVLAGTTVLVLFLIPAALWMHNFWREEDPAARANQMAHFLKNIALAAAVWMLNAVHDWTWRW